MRVKIFSCHHLPPQFTCNTVLFQTLVSNLPAPADGAFMSDLDGVNIAADNLYGELRHQFFVWRNLATSLDYIGFEHYRRPFFIDPLPPADLAVRYPDVMAMRLYFAAFNVAGMRRGSAAFATYLAMRASLDAGCVQQVGGWIGSYDIVVPKANNESIELQWKQSHDPELWDVLTAGIQQSSFFDGRPSYVFLGLERCHFANMYIMRRDLLDEYLRFCFDVLAYCRSQAALTGRALGYFSERVFSFWLYQKRIECPTIRVLELPFIFHDPFVDQDAVGAIQKSSA
ncbi:MAG: DUF4422 domain-containing protein [Proteobacteria bacterium]|nr:DUF4422 domain-containing protein [Pseudomonadota bacterium]